MKAQGMRGEINVREREGRRNDKKKKKKSDALSYNVAPHGMKV
jgi:hypothetical protein